MSREKFEAWYLENWGHTEDNHESLFERCHDGDEYYRLGVRMAYEAWQAASKASEQQLAAVVAENAAQSARTPVAYSYRYAGCETCEGFQDWRWELSKEKPPEWMIETGKVTNLVELFEHQEIPATDAFLAELRAQGVELFVSHMDYPHSPYEFTHGYMDKHAIEFAAQLRQGAAL